ncbi:hypothetical protein MHYP_G00069480 [Metynnis hypsauchen]
MGRGERWETKPKQHTHTSPAHPSASASDSAWANFPARSRRSRAGAIRQRVGVQEFEASRGLPLSRSAERWDWLEGPPKSRLRQTLPDTPGRTFMDFQHRLRANTPAFCLRAEFTSGARKVWRRAE